MDLGSHWPQFHLLFLASRQTFTGNTMTGNIRQWDAELARLSVINAEEIKSVSNGNRHRLLDWAEGDQRRRHKGGKWTRRMFTPPDREIPGPFEERIQ